ncbi:hypothetical protein [Anabaena sp. UHCC 0399]|nr:hypothetical protein [Anabaena sp. UHCC 0399]MEA5564798.1 hypothetical protein [Anabaena sp. UHCC 0399]
MIVSLGGFLGNRGENPFGVGCGDYHDIAATLKQLNHCLISMMSWLLKS